jgi:hypothetical protein
MARRTDPQGLEEVLLVVVDGEEHHLDLFVATGQLLADVEAAGALEPDVEEDDVGPEIGGEAQRLVGLGGGPDDLDPVALGRQHRDQALQYDLVVVDQQEAHGPARTRRFRRGGVNRVCHHRILAPKRAERHPPQGSHKGGKFPERRVRTVSWYARQADGDPTCLAARRRQRAADHGRHRR